MLTGAKYIKLGDVCHQITDGSHNPPNGVEFSDYPMLSSKNIGFDKLDYTDPRYLTKEQFDAEDKRTNVSDGDVLITIVGTIGRTCCIKAPFQRFTLQRSVAVLKPRTDTILPRYLMYCLAGISDYFEKEAKGVAQKGVYLKQLAKVPVPVPSLCEQKNIVEELDLVSGIRNQQKALLNEFDNLSQSIFFEMFGNPIDNEKGWDIKTLGEIATLITNGTTPKGGSEVYVDEGILFLRSQNVWRNRIVYDDIAHIDKETDAKMKKSSLRHHDILITKTGRINTANSSLGRAALFEGESGTANINGHVYLIRLKEGISPHFVIRILTSAAYRDYIRKVCVGGIDKRQINKEHVELFPIIMPPMNLQQSFVEKIEAIERQKTLINQSIAETEKLFDYTMDKYFG